MRHLLNWLLPRLVFRRKYDFFFHTPSRKEEKKERKKKRGGRTEMSFNSTESISFIHIKTNPAVLRSFLQKHLFQSDFFHYFMLPSHPRPHLCCSQVQTSLPGRFCFHCCHTYNARRTRLWADKTCCSRNRSSARRSWPGSGIQTGLRGRCASASAIAGWGWSCQNERLFLSTSHLHLKGGGKAQAVVLVNFIVKERKILSFSVLVLLSFIKCLGLRGENKNTPTSVECSILHYAFGFCTLLREPKTGPRILTQIAEDPLHSRLYVIKATMCVG